MLSLQQRWNARHDPDAWSTLSRDDLIAFCEAEIQRTVSQPHFPGHVALTHPQWKIVPLKPTTGQLKHAGFLPTATRVYEDMLAGAPDIPEEVIQASRRLMDAADTWLPAKTAPRDGTVFLGDVGFPFPVQMCWSEAEERWVITMLAMNKIQGKDDPYFENDWEPVDQLDRWRPLPRIPVPDHLDG